MTPPLPPCPRPLRDADGGWRCRSLCASLCSFASLRFMPIPHEQPGSFLYSSKPVRSARCVSTLSSSFGAGRRLYGSRRVYQCRDPSRPLNRLCFCFFRFCFSNVCCVWTPSSSCPSQNAKVCSYLGFILGLFYVLSSLVCTGPNPNTPDPNSKPKRAKTGRQWVGAPCVTTGEVPPPRGKGLFGLGGSSPPCWKGGDRHAGSASRENFPDCGPRFRTADRHTPICLPEEANFPAFLHTGNYS